MDQGRKNRPSFAKSNGIVLLVALSISTAGCGPSSGVDRMRVKGAVTYGDSSVPAGLVRFEPDTERGGSGPVGFAVITDGAFDTNQGKGPVAGPTRIIVRGYKSAAPGAPPLFPQHTIETDLTKGTNELNLDVPR